MPLVFSERPKCLLVGEVLPADGVTTEPWNNLADGPLNLIDPRFDQDSCGVGFVCSALAKASHGILQDAMTALSRLEHRGAVAADGASSDGVGLMTNVPRALLLKATGVELPENELLGVGMVFTPSEETRAEAVVESALKAQELKVLCWRDVPTRPEILGEIARSTMPKVRQVLVADDAQHEGIDPMERRLYLARKQFERAVELNEVTGYICSLSTQTIVYKAMCLGRLLPEFYPDLASPEYVTAFAIFHQRYATNTLPTWHRASLHASLRTTARLIRCGAIARECARGARHCRWSASRC